MSACEPARRRSAPRAILVTLAVFALSCALSCARDRGADAPTTDVALVVPPESDAAPPTIRPPQRSDYLEVPSASPPIAAAPVDEADGIDIPECRDFLALLKRCMPATQYKDIATNLKQASKDPSMRAAMADVCKRMTDNYQQAMPNGCP